VERAPRQVVRGAAPPVRRDPGVQVLEPVADGATTGLVRYLQQGPRDRPNPGRVAWSSTRNLDTDNPAEAALLMRYAASENPRVEEPVYHFGLSLAEGEHLTREQWEDAAGRVLASMGLADHQAVLIAHRDTDNEHVHIVVNRIGDDGRAWRPFRDMVHAHEAIPGIEIDYGLTRTGRDQAPPDLNAGAVRETMRTGVQPLADRVREQAGHVFAQATSWVELEAGLAELGFRLEPAERGSGLVVTDGSHRVSLSKVDRNLSGPKLAARFDETFRQHREHHPEPPQVLRQAGDRELPPLVGETPAERAAALVDRVTATRATFTKADVQRAAFHEPDSRAIARLALDHDETVLVGKDARGVTRYASPPTTPRSSCSAIPTSSSRSGPATPTGDSSSSTPRPASRPSAARPSRGSARPPSTSRAAASRLPSTPTRTPAACSSPTPATPPAPSCSSSTPPIGPPTPHAVSSFSPTATTKSPASTPASATSAWPPASSAATSPSPAPTTPPATAWSSSRTTTRAAR
jgi:Relaxase/Mobilisation nuclease domain